MENITGWGAVLEQIRRDAPQHASIPFWSWNDVLEPQLLQRVPALQTGRASPMHRGPGRGLRRLRGRVRLPADPDGSVTVLYDFGDSASCLLMETGAEKATNNPYSKKVGQEIVDAVGVSE